MKDIYIYIYEPRINPSLTSRLIDLKISEWDYANLVSHMIKWTSKNKENSNNFYSVILFILNFYKISDYGIYIHKKNSKIKNEINLFFENEITTFKEKFNAFVNNQEFCDEKNYNPFFNELKICIQFYIKYNFSIEKSIRTYAGFINNKFNLSSNKYSNKIEWFVETIKNIGKYYLLMFLNHLFLISNTEKFTNILVISSCFVTNQKFYNFLNENNFFEKYLSNLVNNKNALRKWKQINVFENSIKDIYEELKKIKSNTKLYSILELNLENSILAKLKDYLEINSDDSK